MPRINLKTKPLGLINQEILKANIQENLKICDLFIVLRGVYGAVGFRALQPHFEFLRICFEA